ncbi:MAG: DUF1122 family protein [Dehalococcoidales bacterium]
MSSRQSSVDDLLEREWVLADTQSHPLSNLQEKGLDSYKLVVLLGPKNKIGASYFQIFLQTGSGEVSQQPVLLGLYSRGRFPSYNWIEISRFSSKLSFSRRSLKITNGQAWQLFQYLADLIPPGGHLMVEYDSPEQQETARSLALGIPPAATPLGYRLFLIGCGSSFRDWYFAEGGVEGPRKLQGFKALNSPHAQLKNNELIKELETFLDRPLSAAKPELERTARNRAQAILGALKQTKR